MIDETLIHRAMKATGLSTKKAVIEAGLRLLVEIKAQSGIRELRGLVQWQGDLEEMRRSRIPQE